MNGNQQPHNACSHGPPQPGFQGYPQAAYGGQYMAGGYPGQYAPYNGPTSAYQPGAPPVASGGQHMAGGYTPYNGPTSAYQPGAPPVACGCQHMTGGYGPYNGPTSAYQPRAPVPGPPTSGTLPAYGQCGEGHTHNCHASDTPPSQSCASNVQDCSLQHLHINSGPSIYPPHLCCIHPTGPGHISNSPLSHHGGPFPAHQDFPSSSESQQQQTGSPVNLQASALLTQQSAPQSPVSANSSDSISSQTFGDEEAEALLESGETNIEGAKAKARELVDMFDKVTLNIAVTGETGAGKSSFVNAIRGVKDTDKHKAAPTGVVETTMVPQDYTHPNMPNVKIWDLPGIGGVKFNAKTYIKDVNFRKYDFFLILTSVRIREHDIDLATEIKKNKKNFYFIRTKIDQDVAAEARKGKSEEGTLKVIRDNYEKCLETLGPAPIFLITSHELERFEFKDLVHALERDLPEKKREALIQSLPVYSMEILDKKYETFSKVIWALALTSGAVAAAPVPGLSLAFDIPVVVGFLTKVYHSFGLDDKSLQTMSERVNKPILAHVKKSTLIQALAGKTVQGVAGVLGRLVLAEGVESALGFVPIVGNIAAAGISFFTTRSVLKKGLKGLYKSAKEVIEMAGLDK